ncbi:MAG TPA: AAA family ATPase, partial [Humisphaera sp.]
ADPPGAAYARAVATALVGLDPPAAVRVLALPDLPTGGDVVEYVDGCGDAADPADVRGSIEALAAAVPPEDPAGLVGGPVLTCMADVQPRAVDWLWDGRFALGRQSLIVGVPGGGKSFLTCEMAAHVTTGTPWPDGSPCPRGSVLLICAEDDPADTIRPRLDACGADVSKVHILRGVRRVSADGDADEVMFKLADVKELERALRQIRDCLLVVVDPIGSFLGGGADAHRDNEVRGVLAPLSLLAERYGVAVVLVAHRRKSSAGSADESTLGSRAFTGLARAVWHLSRDPDDPGRRLLLPGKNNLAAASTGLAFRLVGGPTPAVEWEDAPVAMTADDALVAERRRMSGDDGGSGRDDGDARDRGRAEPLRPGPKAVARTAAEHWLTALLANGGMRVGRHEKPEEGTIAAAARAAGFSWGTLRRAREALGIVPVKAEFNDGWYWQLPPADDGDEPPAAAAAEVDAGPTRPPGGGAAACAPSGQPAHLAAGGPPMPPAGLPDVAGPRPGCAPSGGALFAHELATRAGEGARDVQVAAPSGASAGTEVAA